MHTTEELYNLFLTYLEENRFSNRPEELYQPVNYIMELGGKRMRPIMLLMANQLFGGTLEKALPAAYAIEIFHNFSLVHDDIMDEAPLRRGKPTVHRKYDINTGILSGDVMLIYAYQYLVKAAKPDKTTAVIDIFNDTAIKVCEGQQLDMNFESLQDIDISLYIKMISYKTAVLLAGGMKIGAVLGNAKASDANLVYDFAKNIGIAFQLQDDILDTYGDPEKFGKKVGGDIIQNKKTYLVLKTQELANDEDQKSLKKLLSTNGVDEKTKIEAVKSIFDRWNVRKHANILKQSYQDQAFEALAKIELNKDRKQPLIQIANDLINREV